MTSPRPHEAKASKYDFVKVRVWLGEHYHVFSRYLLARMLAVTKIPVHDAIRVALDLKKLLVEQGRLDVLQEQFETQLFEILAQRGYGTRYVSRYRMMTRFHLERVPLVVFLFGTGCVGKSVLATQLATRLNLPRLVHTSTLSQLGVGGGSHPSYMYCPVYKRTYQTTEQMLDVYREECLTILPAVNGEISKCLREGKSVIVEGLHLDPMLYGRLWSLGTPGTGVKRSDSAVETDRDTSYPGVKRAVIAAFLLETDELGRRMMAHNTPWETKTCATTVELQLIALGKYLKESTDRCNPTGNAVQTLCVHPLRLSASLDRLHDVVLDRIAQSLTPLNPAPS